MQKSTAWGSIGFGVLGLLLTLTTLNNNPVIAMQGMGWLTDRTFPIIASVVLLIFGIVLLIKAYTGKVPNPKLVLRLSGLARMLILCVIILLYTFTVNRFGFLWCTIPFVALLSIFFGTKKPLPLILMSGIVPVAIYYLFGTVLSVPLPGI